MSRESCISHKPSNIMAIVKEDYYILMNKDSVAAAILNLFEYWANAAISQNPDDKSPNVGCHSISEFEHMLLGISTDKQIRSRLKLLEDRGFIEIHANQFSGKSSSYRFFIGRVQEALNNLGQTTNRTSVKQPRVVNGVGQTTNRTSVKQPTEPRSNDRSSYIQEVFKEEETEDLLSETGVSDDRPSAKTEQPTDPNPASPCSQVESELQTSKGAKSGKGAKVPRTAKKPDKNASAAEIYASLRDLDAFKRFFKWYVEHCKATVRRDGSTPSPGKKQFAAIAWRDCVENLSESEYQRFRLGCRKFDWNQIGISHAEIFLKHRAWETYLDDEAVGEFLESERQVNAPEVGAAVVTADPETAKLKIQAIREAVYGSK